MDRQLRPEVSVVVVNWNARDFLRDCVDSIRRETRLPHEIIVVDNASSDASAQMVVNEFPQVDLIANDRNLGFAAANNQAIRRASGRYLLFLNPDTVVLDGAIDAMVRWCDEHPDVGCAGCQVLRSETEIQHTCFSDLGPFNLMLTETGLCRAFPKSAIFGRPNYGWWDRRSEMDVDVVSGMFMMVAGSVIDRVGLLDGAFFIYAEEADLCRRIRQAGWRCVFTPIARILHRDGGGKSTDQVLPAMYVQMQKSYLIYIRKHHGIGGLIAARSVLVVSKLTRLTIFGLLAMLTRNPIMSARVKLAHAALMFLVFRVEVGS